MTSLHPANAELHLRLHRDRAEALRAEAQRERLARAAHPERHAPSRLEVLLSALHLRPRVRPA
ncbi:hypothetical protein [Deinococcus apachensis]|uniref:hypothetical protein n=1 Tax=Deinococcus apachensis TaxID=309886 RepID=UPI0012F913A5|nr:hypothetical protein [Deinococcus apachensis]